MSQKSGIEWTDATWNPVSGCNKVSAGCRSCYAETIANRFWKDRKFTDVQCHPERLDQPLKWRKPKRIFVNSMSDLFHEKVPDDFIVKIFATMIACQRHTFQILTKRPERMREFFRYLKEPRTNIWLGVSVEDQKSADERIPLLLQTPAAVRFISAEPMLGPIKLVQPILKYTKQGSPLWPPPKQRIDWWLPNKDWPDDFDYEVTRQNGISWVICGGESGPHARPMDLTWARSLRDQCKAAGTPFFMKQLGSKPFDYPFGNLKFKNKKGGDMSEWPSDLKVRQFPNV